MPKSFWTPSMEVERPLLKETDILIGVMGMTGVGKTSFIKQATGLDMKIGHSLQSCKFLRNRLWQGLRETCPDRSRNTRHKRDTAGNNPDRRLCDPLYRYSWIRRYRYKGLRHSEDILGLHQRRGFALGRSPVPSPYHRRPSGWDCTEEPQPVSKASWKSQHEQCDTFDHNVGQASGVRRR